MVLSCSVFPLVLQYFVRRSVLRLVLNSFSPSFIPSFLPVVLLAFLLPFSPAFCPLSGEDKIDNNQLQARPASSPDRKKPEKLSNASERSEGREQAGGGRVSGGEPLTINLLITEQLKPGPGSVIARQDIIQVCRDFKIHIWPHFSLLQAIEESPRPINKKAVVRDLETILAQEIHLGYLVKVILSCQSAQQISN